MTGQDSSCVKQVGTCVARVEGLPATCALTIAVAEVDLAAYPGAVHIRHTQQTCTTFGVSVLQQWLQLLHAAEVGQYRP